MTNQTMAAAVTNAGGDMPMPTGGRWGWYRDHEGNEWRRVSKLIKKVETDTYNLDEWAKRQVAEGLAIRDDLVLAIKAMGRPDPLTGWSKADKKKISGIVRDATAAAKQRDGARSGTAFHDLTERLDRGEGVESVTQGLPAAAAELLRSYAFLRRENGWRTVEIERTVVNDALECGGTLDRVELIPGLAALLGPGDCQYGHAAAGLTHFPWMDASDRAAYDELPVIADVKTETAPWMNGLHIGPQLAIYSRSLRMWRPTGGTVKVTFSESEGEIDFPAGEYVPAPCVRQDVGVVVHLDRETCTATPLFIDLTEGWDSAQAAYAQMNRESRSKRKLGAAGAWFAAMPNVKRPAPAQMLTEQAVAAQYADPARPATPPSAGEQITAGDKVYEARPREDGWVEWVPADDPLATKIVMPDDVDRQAIETIWASVDVAGLGKVWDIYVNIIGRQWGGRVEEAATARRRQIECPQRGLHTQGKCACGWTQGLPA